MYKCKKCLETISDGEYEYSKRNPHGYFPEECNHQEFCECRNDDDNCICDFVKVCFCNQEIMSIVPDDDNLDGSIPYKHHYFCESCGRIAEMKEI